MQSLANTKTIPKSYVISCDIGTSGMKTCLYALTNSLKLIDSITAWYPLQVLPNGGAEQNPEDWFVALKKSVREILSKSKIAASKIQAISFCSQMQGLVLVDKECRPLRPAMSYMDSRARQEMQEGLSRGVSIKIAGINWLTLLMSLKETGAVAASVKDPVWKYKWVEKYEPQNFARVHKWLDVKDFLVSRLCGKFLMSTDSAFATLLYDSRKKRFSPWLCKRFRVNQNHLPQVIASTEPAGHITATMSKELGLSQDTVVFSGGGDASLIGVGAGAVELHDTHIYNGTSGWVSTVVNKRIVDVFSMMASIVGVQSNLYNYFAELETAGKCLEWIKDHLAADEAALRLQMQNGNEKEIAFTSLYEYMTKVIITAPPGSNGVIFTPWLHGNRCPFEDPNARGIFFNLSLESGKTEMIRAVIEGVAFHMRWFLEIQEKKTKISETIRFVGGGALADNTCQIMADVLSKKIETVANPQNVGAAGAALVAAIGLGKIADFHAAKKWITVQKTFYPNARVKAAYDKNFAVYKKLYGSNKKHFVSLNG